MRFNSSDAELVIDPRVMEEKASIAQERITAYREAYEELASVLEGMMGYWEGAGANEALDRYRSLTGTLETDIRDLESYPEELLRQIGIYEDAQTKMTVIIESISTFDMF